jgi:two-component system, NtrC family, sensor histidine kinase PilS
MRNGATLAKRQHEHYFGPVQSPSFSPGGEFIPTHTVTERAMVHTLRILRWVYLGRLTLAAGIFSGALLVWLKDTSPEATLLATLGLLAALGVTLASLWWTRGLRRAPGRVFICAQLVFDLLLVTLVIHITGGAESSFPPLYILVIAAGSLLLPLPGGLIIGALASVLYLADMVWLHDFEPPRTSMLQMGVFMLVALAAAALGDRLRRAGTVLGAMESALRQLRLDTSEMLAAIDTGLLTIDEEGRLVYINEAAAAQLGLSADEWRGRCVVEALDAVVPVLGTFVAETPRQRRSARRAEFRIGGGSGGGERVLGVRTTVLPRTGGAPWVTAAIQDVTDARQLEELIRRAERLQAVAELGASLAHEIKNPLASIRSAAEQLAGAPLGADDRQKLRGLVVGESERLARLLADFMEFSRVELSKRGVVDIGRVASEAIGLVAQHPDAGGGARIDFIMPVEPVEVEGDHDLLHRAVFNLVLNAVQHAGPRGVVRVEIGRAAELEVPSSLHLQAPIRLIVRDSGPGIREEERPRLFDPFYTTREGGTGLGLAMVHRAVEAHHGAILVDGAPGSGAQFTVYLPAPARRT